MNNFLPDTAPGFDQPIAVLKHCHGRIRKQLATLERLLSHLPEHGADEAARQAAGAVLQVFRKGRAPAPRGRGTRPDPDAARRGARATTPPRCRRWRR